MGPYPMIYLTAGAFGYLTTVQGEYCLGINRFQNQPSDDEIVAAYVEQLPAVAARHPH